MSYSEIENAIKGQFISHFSQLDEERCQIGDVDKVIGNMFSSGERFGCYVEYNGGTEMEGKPFNKSVWVWSIAGIFIIQLSDTIEADLRVIIDRMALMYSSDHTLNGVTPRVRLVDLADAYIGEVADTPFYFLPFLIEAVEPF